MKIVFLQAKKIPIYNPNPNLLIHTTCVYQCVYISNTTLLLLYIVHVHVTASLGLCVVYVLYSQTSTSAGLNALLFFHCFCSSRVHNEICLLYKGYNNNTVAIDSWTMRSLVTQGLSKHAQHYRMSQINQGNRHTYTHVHVHTEYNILSVAHR